MILKKISVTNFRNFKKSLFHFNPFLSVVIGKNSVGKTNLLEAVYFILKGRGFREERQDELVSYSQSFSQVEADFGDDQDIVNYRIFIDSKNAYLKNFFVDKVKKRLQDYLKNTLPVVIFSPNYLNVIDGAMSERRSYFDAIISTYDYEYKKKLANYESGIKKRNKVLEKVADIGRLKEQLLFWDDYLIKEAAYLCEKRTELADFININPSLDSKHFSLKYNPSLINHQTLLETFDRQLYIRRTLVGPQRDNYEIFLTGLTQETDVHRFGSRSEQRLALFWIIEREIDLYIDKIKSRPIVLLDDIFSELDSANKSLILKLIKKNQTIVTTTENEVLTLLEGPHSIIEL